VAWRRPLFQWLVDAGRNAYVRTTRIGAVFDDRRGERWRSGFAGTSFRFRQVAAVMKLIVGLGNPGAKYARNRHNIGFMAVERIADRHRFTSWRRRFQGTTSDGEIAGEKVLLLRPETYMNESGRAVGEAVRFLKIEPADVIAIHDELDLAPGKLKIKAGGGNAGHNGLKSISAHIGNEYVRLRLGIGHPGHKDAVAGYVLHDFAKADADWLEPLLDAIAGSVDPLASGDLGRFQTDVARRLAPEPTTKSKPDTVRRDPATSTDAGRARQPRSPGSDHPAGERIGKRQSAIADNLKRWLAARNGKE
jgi:PTH1 family peptidyl-tRNA hydrolase